MFFPKRSGQSGFSLVELVIVVLVLGGLAVMAVPRLSSSTNEADPALLDSTLAEMRNAIELYYHQHGEYPSINSAGSDYGSVGSVEAFTNQLTKYTNSNGDVVELKSASHKYGPYLKTKGLPKNPLDGSNSLVIANTGDVAAIGTGAGGWWFDNVSGKLLANISSEYDK